jgi:hypothetical protein
VCLAASHLTCHPFSQHDGDGEDDASYDPPYDDLWDAFFYGVNRAQGPPQNILQKIKNTSFLGKQLNSERQKPKTPAPELSRVAQSGAVGKFKATG